MKSLSFKRKLLVGAVLGVCALAGTLGSASASPLLQITGNNLGQEVIGDPGGTSYSYAGGPGPGAGVPSSIWPTSGAGFAPDPSFGNALGTSGYHSGYLNLTESAYVTFQFMGGGNSSLQNQFWLDLPTDAVGVYTMLFQDSHNGGPTNPCPVAPGATAPSCDQLVGGPLGQNQYSIFLGAGLIPFKFITGLGVTLDNLGVGNGNPDPHTQTGLPGYFLGVDPYLATGQYQTSGTTVYAGLSDLAALGDHDYQDMGVRISTVPEPGSLALLSLAMGGLVFMRRRAKPE